MFSRTENTIEEIKVKSIESGSKTANKIEPSSVDLRAAQANRNITTKNGKNNKKISPNDERITHSVVEENILPTIYVHTTKKQ